MHDDDDAKAILKRRARYVAMALAGLGTATHATACVCLEASVDAGDPYADANTDARSFPIDADLDAHFVDDALGPDANYDMAVERDVGPAADDASDAD